MTEKGIYAAPFKKGELEEITKEPEYFFCKNCRRTVRGEREYAEKFFIIRCPFCEKVKSDHKGNAEIFYSNPIKQNGLSYLRP